MKRVIKDQKVAFENLLIAREVFRERGIEFMLMFGTLLGAVREHGFIPHDDDVDLEVYERDAEAFFASFPALAERGLAFVENIKEKRLYTFHRGGEQLDVNIAIRRRTVRGPRWDLEGRTTVPARFLDSLDEIEFLGERFKVPHDPVGFVRNLYGKTWNIPIAHRQSRRGWLYRIKKALKKPGKLVFYAKRYLSTRQDVAALARREKKVK